MLPFPRAGQYNEAMKRMRNEKPINKEIRRHGQKGEKKVFSLNSYGYVTKYLVTELLEEPYAKEIHGSDQLECEKRIRESIKLTDHTFPEGEIRAGKKGALGKKWKYYFSHENWFIDQSRFYPSLTLVQMDAATILHVPEEMEAEAWLWSYAGVSVWVNEKWAGEISVPRYKPIWRQKLTFPLKKGENLIYLRLTNLGARDTRTLAGLQFPGAEKEKIKIILPDEENLSRCIQADRWLSGLRVKGDKLFFPFPAPEDGRIVYDTRPVDFCEYHHRYLMDPLYGGQQENIALRENQPFFRVEITAEGQKLSRSFERNQLLHPLLGNSLNEAENRERVFRRIGQVKQIPRGDKESFSMYPILARYYLGTETKEDRKEIEKTLRQIDRRRDCSDFLVCGLVRFLKLYPVDEALAADCRQVLTHYRYWMDQEGTDGMCFWSENHSLMFFVSAYIAGDLYPEEWFVRAGMQGAELKRQAEKRLKDWLNSVIEEGFEEFHSGGYTPITFAALLNVVDFTDAELGELAWRAEDKLMMELAKQVFDGVSIAPMGRVYREVLYPFAQDIQCLVNLADPSACDRFSEWIIFLATSRYHLPSGLKKMMNQLLSLEYEEGNAMICVEKSKAFMLTSVQSPRKDGKKRTWENFWGSNSEKKPDKRSFAYAKSLNECFHGTTQIEPGVYGYQQHLWYGALSRDAVFFVNHPGGSCEECSARPGYWYGNGIMPAIRQVKNLLLAIYEIPETHPIPFTHLYWPASRFEEQIRRGKWLAARVRNGAAALWCSEELTAHEDWMEGCEYRAEKRKSAYVCIMGELGEETLEEFLTRCRKEEPVYHKETGYLEVGELSLVYEAHENMTQYV